MLNDTAEHETRCLILQAAHRPFMEQGYRAVSTRQIAAACGITQPALYRHFATQSMED
jgi:AcrR family transcriptional regulator